MRRALLYSTGRLATVAVLALLAVAGAALAGAQPRPYPVYNEYHLDRTMKLVGRNFEGARQALAAADFETAKALFTRTREQVAVSITYWRHNERDDGIRMLREVLDGLDDLDAALSRPPIDTARAGELAAIADAACQTCHGVYRTQDPDTGDYSVNLSK